MERQKKQSWTNEARVGLFLCVLVVLVLAFELVHRQHGLKNKPAEPVPVAAKPISAREISHGDATKKQIIFTFDGGSGAQSGEKILQVLAKHGVKGTFFLTGKFVEANPALVKKMVAAGDEIFSHTYDHPYLTKETNDQIDSELGGLETVLEKTAGLSPKPYFRPPYGDRDQRVLSEAFKDGYESVVWTVDAGDWEEPNGMTAAEVEKKILSSLAPGNIYLMHVGDDITGQILDEVFTTIESRGYKLVLLTQGL